MNHKLCTFCPKQAHSQECFAQGAIIFLRVHPLYICMCVCCVYNKHDQGREKGKKGERERKGKKKERGGFPLFLHWGGGKIAYPGEEAEPPLASQPLSTLHACLCPLSPPLPCDCAFARVREWPSLFRMLVVVCMGWGERLLYWSGELQLKQEVVCWHLVWNQLQGSSLAKCCG